jgi:hypothetical protein
VPGDLTNVDHTADRVGESESDKEEFEMMLAALASLHQRVYFLPGWCIDIPGTLTPRQSRSIFCIPSRRDIASHQFPSPR